MQFYQSAWIKQFGAPICDTIQFIANDLNSAANLLPEDPELPRNYIPADDETKGSLIVTAHSLAKLVEAYSGASDIPIPFIQKVLKNLTSNTVAIETTFGRFGSFALFANMLQTAIADGELYGAALGKEFFIAKKVSSIIEIVVENQHGEISTGTGYVLSGSKKPILQTCNHCIFDENGSRYHKITARSGETKLHLRSVMRFDRIDCALIEFESDLQFENTVTRDAHTIAPVVTSGYPRLFRPEGNPLMFHSGEVNGWIGTVEAGNRMGITSANVAPGNSGGAVFDNAGSVVGMITEQAEDRRLVEYEGLQAGTHITTHNLFTPTSQISYDLHENRFTKINLE
jgi:S1-C subfamily serine protease